MRVPLPLMTDGYKPSQWEQYPKGTTRIFSYLESRGGEFAETVFFGLQPILKMLENPVTMEDVEYTKMRMAKYGVRFNYEGWKRLVEKHQGRLPIKIRAIPEGTIVPVKNVLMTIENTDPEFFWLTNYLETILMRVWYPITVATTSKTFKSIIAQALMETEGSLDGIEFKLHDFGARGVSSSESAQIGGGAHLVNFQGSDTLESIEWLSQHYDIDMAANSINASEHSTITSWKKEGEFAAYENMVDLYKNEPLFACVSDSWDIFEAIKIWGKLKQRLEDNGTHLVVRPDSGDPVDMSGEVAEALEKEFGFTYNKKGFKVLNGCSIIYGDGIDNPNVGRAMLWNLINKGYSAKNLSFGMGGGLLQKCNRDTLKFAMKCSLATVDGKDIEVYKDPITDHGKKSKRGYIDLKRGVKGEFITTESPRHGEESGSCLVTVFENGKLLVNHKFSDIRNRVNSL